MATPFAQVFCSETMNKTYFLRPTAGRLRSALDAWQWIGLDDKKPILVTAFADVFFRGADGIWFLDTIEGQLKFVCSTRRHLDQLLTEKQWQQMYLLSHHVDRALSEGNKLGEGQCYNFARHPVAGGTMEYENVERINFVVALHIKGQMHDKLRQAAPDAGEPVAADDAGPAARPWWKVW